MPSAIWTGALSFGMVVVPVRLHAAVHKKTVRFHELDRQGRRVRHVRVPEPVADWDAGGPAHEFAQAFERAHSPETPPRGAPMDTLAPHRVEPPAELSYHEIQKGYEVAPGQYVSMTRDEIEALAPERSRVIDVQQFVDVEAVDPIYFEARYYVVPDRQWSAPFRLLHRAMHDSSRMAIAWVTLRSRRYLSAVRPYGDVMLLTTLVHADEVVPADFKVPDAGAAPTERELKMARLLIDTLSGPFEPEQYPDEHRRRLLAAIDERSPVAAEEPAAPSPTRVMDLMAALEASVKAARAARDAEQNQAKPKRRRSRGA